MADVARHFGFAPNRYGNILCPFHKDHKPSCKLYEQSFYCFACGEGGDSITFAARYLQLSNLDAAKYLAAAFGLMVDEPRSLREHMEREKQERTYKEKQAQRERAKRWEDWQAYAFRTLNDYKQYLRQYEPDAYLQQESQIDYYMEWLANDAQGFYKAYGKGVNGIAKYMETHRRGE